MLIARWDVLEWWSLWKMGMLWKICWLYSCANILTCNLFSECSTLYNQQIWFYNVLNNDTINKTLAIFRISITTDKENSEYQFTHSVSACYVPGTCDQTYNIFQNTKFSIKTCDYTGGFLDSSMYLSNHFVTILVIFIEEKLANLMQWNW